jgi:hypothetical protein
MTHVPQLVADRWQRKHRADSTWIVPQFGQRHVAMDSESTR